MSANLENKKQVVTQINQTISGATTVVLAQYQSVTVSQMTHVRSNARKANVYLHVLKNTLARRAVKGTTFEPLADKMSGPLIYSISADPVAAAKIIYDFAKTNEAVKIVAGMMGSKMLDAAAINKLAVIPSRVELLSTLLGMMKQIPAQLVRTLAAIRDQKAA